MVSKTVPSNGSRISVETSRRIDEGRVGPAATRRAASAVRVAQLNRMDHHVGIAIGTILEKAMRQAACTPLVEPCLLHPPTAHQSGPANGTSVPMQHGGVGPLVTPAYGFPSFMHGIQA